MRLMSSLLFFPCFALVVAGCGSDKTAEELTVPTNNTSQDEVSEVETYAGFTVTGKDTWNTTSVRKVLNTFAFGGQATEEQIQKWADALPQNAIQEILSFEPHNNRLSPPEGPVLETKNNLEQLQLFFSSGDVDNPIRPDRREVFNEVLISPEGQKKASLASLQETWLYEATTRGLNPFRSKIGLYLTNYLMAVDGENIRAFLTRDFYDGLLAKLEEGASVTEILAYGATSAAIARQYEHRTNIFKNNNGIFVGNDDFAREFHQLFFMIQGDIEESDYHENVTIEHTAWLLTGMNLNRVAWRNGSHVFIDWWDSPIDFTDHATFGQTINNFSNHYLGCLEILHETICGNTAQEKINNLVKVAISHPESMSNMPVSIVSYFADDNLNDYKKDIIRAAWKNSVPKDLLEFLRGYAISSIFHTDDTIKFKTAFDRNLIVQNLNTLSNEEKYALGGSVRLLMKEQGSEIFNPLHNVFGGQKGIEASVNSALFKHAYKENVENSGVLASTKKDYSNSSGELLTWKKDWANIVNPNINGSYHVGEVGLYLWKRFIADEAKNYDQHAKNQVESLLATGMNYDYDNLADYSEVVIPLNSIDPIEREDANRRIGLAVSFITMTPYMFATEGGQ